MDLSTPMVVRFSFNLSGFVPNALTTMGLSLRPTSFRFLEQDLVIFLLSRTLFLSPFHHLELPRL